MDIQGFIAPGRSFCRHDTSFPKAKATKATSILYSYGNTIKTSPLSLTNSLKNQADKGVSSYFILNFSAIWL